MNLITLESVMKGLEHFDLALEKRSVDEYVYHLRRNGDIVASHVEKTSSIQKLVHDVNLVYNKLMHKYTCNLSTVVGRKLLLMGGEHYYVLSKALHDTGVYYLYARWDDSYPLSCVLTIGRIPLMHFDNVHFCDADMDFFINQYLERAFDPETGCSNDWRIV